jgi:hypothetical protein
VHQTGLDDKEEGTKQFSSRILMCTQVTDIRISVLHPSVISMLVQRSYELSLLLVGWHKSLVLRPLLAYCTSSYELTTAV